MRSMHRLAARLLLAALAVTLLTTIPQASGQNSGDTGGLSSILQGLSPDQRDTISQSLGGVGGGAGSTGVPSTTLRTTPFSEEQQDMMLRQQRDMLMEAQRQRNEAQRLSPFLQPEDWVVVSVDTIPLPAIAAQPATNPLPSQLGNLPGILSSQQSSAPAALTREQAITQNPLLAATAANSGQQPNAALGVAAASSLTQAGNQPIPPQGVTAGGYTPLPPSCAGQPNCDPEQPTQPELTEEQKHERKALIDLIRIKNPYQLTRDGSLTLPGFAPIPLAGLTEQLATLRLGAEPVLRDLYIRVTKLPLVKSGPTALKPFGYDLFDHPISTFAPSTNVPVPANYVIGPGDQFEVQLYGTHSYSYKLVVDRDGVVSFPQLGPIHVGGQTFGNAKADIESRVDKQMVGVHANVAMGDTRSIRVFVLGDAKFSGSYTISGLGTISSALFAAGGVQTIGSLRNIQLKRHGELVRRLDLYDMLIRGDTTDDARLLPDDVIFIPPIGATVTVDGEVHRPAIYEVRNETSVADAIALAGGLTAEADTNKLALTRIDADLHRVVRQIDLSGAAGRAEPVRNGDMLRISRLRPTLDAGILVQGYVYTPGSYAYRPSMHLTDVLRSVDDLKPNADLHYILIRREEPPDRHVSVLSADLTAALAQPGSAADPALMARDRIMVFDLQSNRDSVIRPLLDDLKVQARIGQPDEVVRIDGSANVPGQYPFEAGMTVRDLIRAGGGLSDAAYGGSAELTRYQIVNGEQRKADVTSVDLAAVLRGDPAANLRLEPFDTLSVREVQAWADQETITLRGQVKFTGRYSIKPGETLRSVLGRAGGLTQFAFVRGAVFSRRELRDREQKELDMLAVRMQNDIAFVALGGAVAGQAGAASALSVGQTLLGQLRQAKAVGRLVINLPALMRSPVGSGYDVVLRDGDELIVPKFQQEVTVIGEVQTVTSHLYRAGLSRNDYIAMSGGTTVRADKGRIYVVRADGSVVTGGGARWFAGADAKIEPGDTIVVPLNAEHMPPLPLWQAVSQILYNLAIATLAVHQF